jgi:hypothetical protein
VTGKEIEITMKSEEQSKLFSHKKALKVVKFNTKNDGFKI